MKPLFKLGLVVITPKAATVLESVGAVPKTLLHNHVTGNWGTAAEDAQNANDHAVKHGWEAIHSVYEIANGVIVWVITEWDRSVTTILLPEDY